MNSLVLKYKHRKSQNHCPFLSKIIFWKRKTFLAHPNRSTLRRARKKKMGNIRCRENLHTIWYILQIKLLQNKQL